MTIQEQIQQLQQTKEQIAAQQQAVQQAQIPRTPLSVLYRPQGSPQAAQVQRQQQALSFTTAKGEAAQQLQAGQQQVAAYEKEFTDYLKTPSGIKTYAQELGNVSIKEENRPFGVGFKDTTGKQQFLGGQAPVKIYSYSSPFGNFTEEDTSGLQQQQKQVQFQADVSTLGGVTPENIVQLQAKYSLPFGVAAESLGAVQPKMVYVNQFGQPISYSPPKQQPTASSLIPFSSSKLFEDIQAKQQSVQQPYQPILSVQPADTSILGRLSFLGQTTGTALQTQALNQLQNLGQFIVTPIKPIQQVQSFVAEQGGRGIPPFYIPKVATETASLFIPTTPLDIGLTYTGLKFLGSAPQVLRVPIQAGITYLGVKGAANPELTISQRLASGTMGVLGAGGLISEIPIARTRAALKSFEAKPFEVTGQRYISNNVGVDVLTGIKETPFAKYTFEARQPFFATSPEEISLAGGKGFTLEVSKPMTAVQYLTGREPVKLDTFSTSGILRLNEGGRIIEDALLINPKFQGLLGSPIGTKISPYEIGTQGVSFLKPTSELKGTMTRGYSPTLELNPRISIIGETRLKGNIIPKPEVLRSDFIGVGKELPNENRIEFVSGEPYKFVSKSEEGLITETKRGKIQAKGTLDIIKSKIPTEFLPMGKEDLFFKRAKATPEELPFAERLIKSLEEPPQAKGNILAYNENYGVLGIQQEKINTGITEAISKAIRQGIIERIPSPQPQIFKSSAVSQIKLAPAQTPAVTQSFFQTTKQTPAQQQTPIQRQTPNQVTTQLQNNIQKQTPAITTAFKFSEIQRQPQTQIQLQKQGQVQKQTSGQVSIFDFGKPASPGFYFKFSNGKENKFKKKIKTKTPQYITSIRRRGRFIPIARTSSLEEASRKGYLGVKRSLAASFKITTPTGQAVKPFMVSPELRPSKRNPLILVQKQRYPGRISTIGEKREIQQSRKRRKNLFF